MSKHTPGPWQSYETVHGAIAITTSEADPDELNPGKIVARCGLETCAGGWAHDETDEANARLIAAAPDLLEACKAVVAYEANPDNTKPWHVILDHLTMAIDKAEGADG